MPAVVLSSECRLIERSPTQQFYSGSNVLLTGATGFLGKTIIEKLFRLAPDIGSVYITIRAKKDQSVEKRIEKLFQNAVFDRVKSEVPDFQQKIFPLTGDFSEPNLGLSREDIGTIQSKINIVIHAAATVNFEEELKTALRINVKGTKTLLDICKECTSLKSFVYVSTAFAHCIHSEIAETFYEQKTNGEKLIAFVENQNDHRMENMTSKILGPYPNTYAFTKALAEDVIRRNCQGLPVAVFRPAIVIGSHREPIPGWIDNLYGPTGVVVAVGAGLLRVMCADRDRVADIVPIDMVVNAIIATAWSTAQENSERPSITNYVSSRRNPITWGEFFFWNMTFGQTFPTVHALWYYTLTMTTNKYWYMFLSVFQHFLPAAIMDLGLIITARKPRMVRAYKKIHKFLEVIAHFSTNQWSFQDDHVQVLWEQLDPRDRALLPFQIEQVKWDEFFLTNIKTMRWSLLNDTPETLPRARERMHRIRFLHYAMKYIFLAYLLYFLYNLL